ncbi:hypothetical protein RND81_12G001000 [Saponaria officinalis]|uniref:OTU domain-containing protein n=1 Tax=Saponaria officinalis TaxID=3572 RepID=A0AAW1H661_SAPOF
MHAHQISQCMQEIANDDIRSIIRHAPIKNKMSNLEELFEELRDSDPTLRRSIVESIHSQLHPEVDDVEEPAHIENRRGQPRRSTTRNLSRVEHVRRAHTGSSNPIRVTSPAPTATFTTDTSAPFENNFVSGDDYGFRFFYLIPNAVVDHLKGWFDPVGDGHCDFRSMSHALRGDQSHYTFIRVALLRELQDSAFDYEAIYGEESASCGNAHWMDNDDLNALATMYNWTICVIGSRTMGGTRVWDGCSTYLPLRSITSVTKPFGILSLLFMGNHWMRQRLDGEFPMPPVTQLWRHVRDDSVKD